ncbi:unnamed protein product [Ambrosiozyma monospora]|uniref:Unnamed protein product n=1 Tax=Ambrosiozyma monospora TaxID=43982 RepID=A0A9W7DK84_AMBMO|nr:unnamed protein product [Ambrosiozyma monospora]
MPRGKYIIAGKTDPDSLGHYLFNLPSYTHFTAPLRRYADIIVHRQFKAAITNPESYRDEIDSLKMNSDYCNFKKDCAKAAQEQAIHLLLCQTINEMSKETGQILVMGTILQVYESSFDVFLPEFGIEKRVHGDQLPLRKAEFDKTQRVLELYWEPGVDAATYVPPDEKEPLSYRASIKNKYRSSAREAAAKQADQLANSVSDELIDKFAKLDLSLPTVESLQKGADGSDGSLGPYMKECITRIENDSYVQEIRELKKVPILLKSEVGMTLPCLTVRTLNPFAELSKK